MPTKKDMYYERRCRLLTAQLRAVKAQLKDTYTREYVDTIVKKHSNCRREIRGLKRRVLQLTPPTSDEE